MPIKPASDDEVIEVLPAVPGGRAEQKRLRKALAEQPRDVALALTVARRYLEQAHESGDPRFAGMAMAAIEPWSDEATMPDDLLMMRATVQQYLHQFDDSVRILERLLARPSGKGQSQAWLTLATVRRVQGRYADSDAACTQLAQTGAALACARLHGRERRAARRRRSGACRVHAAALEPARSRGDAGLAQHQPGRARAARRQRAGRRSGLQARAVARARLRTPASPMPTC